MNDLIRITSACLVVVMISACELTEPNPCEEANVSAAQNMFREAIALANVCLAQSNIDTQSMIEGYRARAWGYHGQADYVKAASDQLVVVSLDTHASQELINASLFLRKANRIEESLQMALLSEQEDRAAERVRMNTQYHLGWSYFDFGDYEKAIEAFSVGIPEQPDYAPVYWRRGMAYHRLGKSEEARKDFEQFAKLAPGQLTEADFSDEIDELRTVFAEYSVEDPFLKISR